MKAVTKRKLKEAHKYCDEHDKSTEYMIAYMQGYAGVNHDCVMNYLISKSEKR